MKKCLSTTLFLSFTILFVFLLTDAAIAQPRWARGRSKQNVEQTIRRVEIATDRFVSQLKISIERSRTKGRFRNENSSRLVKELEEAAGKLCREYDRRDPWWENRNKVEACIIAADNLIKRNRPLSQRRADPVIRYLSENHKTLLRRMVTEVNKLAGIYNLRKI